MKSIFKRILLVVMVILMLGGVIMPAAMADESRLVSNIGKMTVYVGEKYNLFISAADGSKESPDLFTWKSSNSSVVSVNKKGDILAKKRGFATITATRKSNGQLYGAKVAVKYNKVDKIKPKPSVSEAPYKGCIVRLKSVEVASPSKIVVEYYLCCNFPSNWTMTRIKSLQDAINLFDRSTGKYKMTIVGDEYQLKAKSVTGLKRRQGSFVQVIKATYTGNRINTNVKLSDYLIDDSTNIKIDCDYSYR